MAGRWQAGDVADLIEPFASLRRVAGRLITVADLDRLTLWGPAPDQDAASAMAVMESEQYDVAPLWRSRYIAS